MSELAQRLAGLSPAQRQLLEKRLAQQRPTAEPIAIIGMACRFPGAPNLDAYWRLICDRVNTAREVPAERWNLDEFYDATGETPGKMSVRWAALIDNPDQFDPQFFGITPREAARMDPQQRILLEVAWEAMENAGRPADQLAGSRTGVFVGIGGTDYSKVAMPYDDYYQHIDAHMGTGNALSIAANRLSYIFDFHGPSAAIDTACSSASLGIHFAVESLRRGESDAALAGGVNMILTPETTIAFSKARMLSAEGRCRPFDAAADGYVRGEGCGVVLLKRLADAERDGDNVLAVLRATSVNQDGRTSGISAPNSQSQIACIRAAQKQAGVMPDQIGYVEAHGTGTPLGDPIEMQALCEIFRATPGDRASAAPCYVASVKANVGHMETVSGVAGLIKVILMMQHDTIVPQTGFETLNPHINLAGTRLAIPTEPIAWRADGARRIAGISSFGFGGTNTHLIVESSGKSPLAEASSPTGLQRPLHVLKLSARSEAALVTEAADLATYLAELPDVVAADVCYSANTGRADFNHRAVITAKDAKQLGGQLTELAAGNAPAGVKRGAVRTIGRPKVAFLFTGQGSQYVGMGRTLYETQPVFRRSMDACSEILAKQWAGKSLLSILYPPASLADDPTAPVHQTEFTQPALFALEYALAELWQSWGVVPDIVAGHSVGEYPAACVAGVMSLEDGLALIAERARLMQAVKRRGKMAVVFADRERVAAALNGYGGRVVIAVLNGPENTVVSGEAEAVEALADQFTAEGVQTKLLNVSHAFHSPLMDEMLDEFEALAGRIEFHPPHVPFAANLTGELMAEPPTARYWRDHLRNTVQFAADMARVAEAAPAIVLEMGPTASLLGMGRRCVPQLDAAWLPSLRQGQDDWQVLAASVAEYYVRGGQIDWRAWDQPWPRRRLLIPNYPFERSRHWYKLDPALKRSFSGAAAAAGIASGHPLLGARLSTVWTNTLFETSLSARSPGYLVDHQVQGSVVVPAAAYIEQGLAAAEQLFGPGKHGIDDLVIQQVMFLPEGVRRRVQVSLAPESSGESTFETYSRPADAEPADATWPMHATGSLVHETHAAKPNSQEPLDLSEIRSRATSITSRSDFYRMMAERGLAYGPTFQVLGDFHRGPDDGVVEVKLPESVVREAARYQMHPAIGDALLQAMAGAVPLEQDGSFSPFTYVPVGIRHVRFIRPVDDFAEPLFIYANRISSDSSPSPERVEANVYLTNGDGDVLIAFEGVQVQRLGRSGPADAAVDMSRWLYRTRWQPQLLTGGEAASARAKGTWLILADKQGIGAELANELAARGQESVLVKPGGQFKFEGGASANGKPGSGAMATVDPLQESHYEQLLKQAFGQTDRRCRGIVHLWSLDVPDPSSSADAWKISRELGSGSALQLIRALARASLPATPQLWLVSAGAQAVDAATLTPIAVAQSPLLGFGRVAALEHPELQSRLVDLDQTGDAQATAMSLADELVTDANDGEVAYRGGQRFVARLARESSLIDETAVPSTAALAIPHGKPFQLRITQAGSFDALRFAPVERQAPAAGQVEIEVRATGLNFSDVLKALGLYPGIKDAIVPLGIEASGIVTAVGEGVTRFKLGDEVFGVVPYAFASHALTAEYALVCKLESIQHDEACTIPVTFLTAYYGLVRLAQIQRGERLLIHAGAGGVGLAAIQIAQHLGAEIFATAGSEEKREFLRSLGVKHVYSSRSVAFAEEILADTNREGVDVVLNSLPGEAITKSLSILRAYGRFLEIGKTDIYQNRMIGLLPFQDNLSYFAIDLDRMLRQRSGYIRGLFFEVMEHFAAGHYRPLSFTRLEAQNTIDAFRYMSQRKNIGKVVVWMAERGARSEERAEDSRSLVRTDGTYLITGGLGALGLRVAEWLAEQGAGAIALLSRREPTAEAELQLTAIRARGTQVITLQGDVADADSLAAALKRQPPDAPPLRGVIHAAGVLADGIITEMTLAQLDRAMAPKVQGAWNLHTATQKSPLDFFILFSSVASVLGSPGQANYAAGNAMLDALAHARRAAGLAATAINWGPWADSGMAAEQGRGEAVKSRGMNLIPPEQGLELLGKLLSANVPQVAVMDAHWPDMLRLLGSRRPPLLADIAGEIQIAGGTAAGSRVDYAFRERLLAENEAGQQALARDYIRDELARIMGVAPDGLEADQPLSTFGLDSLLALELKNNLEGRLDFTLPMAKLMEGPSIASLATETVRLVIGSMSRDADGKRAAADSSADERWSPLIALRATGTRPPLFLLPALGGDIRCYDELVQKLGKDQRVYAIRPRGIDQDLPPHQTIEEMIADYAAAIREVQPKGPYHLAGWSTGGIYAFALAEAMDQSGEQVDLLALFDAPLPSIVDDIDPNNDVRFLCNLVNFANCFAGTKMRVNYEQLLALAPHERFPTALAEARKQGTIPAETPEEYIRRIVHVGEANVRAIQSYEPRQIAGDVQFFIPIIKGGLAEIAGIQLTEERDHGWSDFCENSVDLHTVPGDHFSMMTGDGADQIAAVLSALMDEALAVPK
jgi:acyl transferase domain-containing protein/thioesterase domain-containing protein/acyl carrier protein